MIIKLVEENACKNAIVSLNKSELVPLGLDTDNFSLTRRLPRLLVRGLFDTLEELCGLKRDGCFTAVTFRPFSDGGCRIDLIFTGLPCGRLYRFSGADQLLDAVNMLRVVNTDVSGFVIDRQGNSFTLYIPADEKLSVPALYILNEYSV